MNKFCKNNNDFADLIISDLTSFGITNFCIGSGSRSCPLALSLKNNTKTESILYYDERSIGFFAVGLSKSLLKPTCVITTSGSAVANLSPAVMEAYMDGVPLIIITCDRPFEDKDRGLNQTCKQDGYFSSYVHYSKTLITPYNFNPSVISSHISYSVNTSNCLKGPVHLNIEFKEPLITETPKQVFTHTRTKYLPTEKTLSSESLEYITDILSGTEKGIIVVGGNFDKNTAASVIDLAEKLHFPILADPLSGIREQGKNSLIISHYNQIIHHVKKINLLNPDLIIFLGGHIVSKNILLWSKHLKNCQQILVTDKPRHVDPNLEISLSINLDSKNFCECLINTTKRKPPCSFPSLWKQYALTVENSVENFFEDQEELYEPMSITNLIPILEETPFPIFLGNSLTIRYGDNFLFPKKITQKIYGNRGVSGIDGNISTAAGICKGLNMPMVAVMGDLTFFHDIGSLNLINKHNLPLIIIVINNQGGGIFDFLPYGHKKEFINTHISPTADLQIGNIASSFNIPFWKATTSNEYKKMIKHLIYEKTGGIIEIPSNKEENIKIHTALDINIEKDIQQSIKREKTSYFSFSKKQTLNQTSYVFTDS